MHHCLNCNKALKGRPDKKYCDDNCRNEYFNRQKELDRKEIRTIDLAIKKNRKILKEVLVGKTSVNISEQDLQLRGFVFYYHTHQLTTKGEQKEYVFCYDYGYHDMRNGWFKVVKSFK
jgi:predicted nucleic acid-binding Zn ribbon protein